jgi:hypothetical protein
MLGAWKRDTATFVLDDAAVEVEAFAIFLRHAELLALDVLFGDCDENCSAAVLGVASYGVSSLSVQNFQTLVESTSIPHPLSSVLFAVKCNIVQANA